MCNLFLSTSNIANPYQLRSIMIHKSTPIICIAQLNQFANFANPYQQLSHRRSSRLSRSWAILLGFAHSTLENWPHKICHIKSLVFACELATSFLSFFFERASNLLQQIENYHQIFYCFIARSSTSLGICKLLETRCFAIMNNNNNNARKF